MLCCKSNNCNMWLNIKIKQLQELSKKKTMKRKWLCFIGLLWFFELLCFDFDFEQLSIFYVIYLYKMTIFEFVWMFMKEIFFTMIVACFIQYIWLKLQKKYKLYNWRFVCGYLLLNIIISYYLFYFLVK